MTRHPTLEMLAAWEVLTAAARSHAEEVLRMSEASARLPSADRLVAARRACRELVLPDGQQMSGAPMVRLLRLVDRWAVMNSIDRHAHAAELRNTAIEAATLAGFGQ